MIKADTLKQLLTKVPDDATIYAYEGEDTGIQINMPDGTFQWIRATASSTEDKQTEFSL